MDAHYDIKINLNICFNYKYFFYTNFMLLDKQKYQKIENLNNKENLCYVYSISNPLQNSKDPIHNLISNFDEIKHIYNCNLKENKKFLYFNKEKIHKILYDLDEILRTDDKEDIKLSELFYFLLLLVDNPDLIIIIFLLYGG